MLIGACLSRVVLAMAYARRLHAYSCVYDCMCSCLIHRHVFHPDLERTTVETELLSLGATDGQHEVSKTVVELLLSNDLYDSVLCHTHTMYIYIYISLLGCRLISWLLSSSIYIYVYKGADPFHGF